MSLSTSDATAINVALYDTVTELEVLANIIGMNISKRQNCKQANVITDPYLFEHMSQVLKSYSLSADKYPNSKISSNTKRSYYEFPSLVSTIEDSFDSISYMNKLKIEVLHSIDIFKSLITELGKSMTFDVLSQHITKKESHFKEIENNLKSETFKLEKIIQLKQKIEQQKLKNCGEMEKYKETLAHLKDQVQEMKAKTIMEEKYYNRSSLVKLEQLELKQKAERKELSEQIELILAKQDQEGRTFAETQSYLNDYLNYLHKHEEYWQEKAEIDVIDLRRKLESLKANKENGLHRLKELSTLYDEYEAVVLEDRIAKEKARQQKLLEQLQLEATCKIQNWWRTVCVRHSLGPYRKKKGKRKSKGAKKAKKK